MSALILWVSLWLNLNTGFWNIQSPQSMDDWQLLIRAIVPYVVLPVAGLMLVRSSRFHMAGKTPSTLLFVYGCFAAFSTVFSPGPTAAMYWSATFLATILAAWTFLDRRDPVRSARQLLLITWIGTFLVAAIIARQASGAIFNTQISGYGASIVELHGLSRSSGVARWAAVPGLVCLIRAYHSRRFFLVPVFLGLAGLAFFIVYRMQSRGAVFGSVAALLFALLFSSRMRRYALPFALLAIVVVLLVDSPATISDRVTTYLERGQSQQEFLSMTGRTRAYNEGIAAFQEAPVFGYGQWADRMVIFEHVHNSYLAALMNSGIIGFIPYMASWIVGWMLFFKLQNKTAWLSPEDRISLLEAGTVMMFFTVRAIPETTTAEFSVDLLVMVAVYVYLETLTAHLKTQRQRQPVQAVSRVSFRLVETGQPASRRAYREI